jgi:hypothetical protein
MKKYLFIIMAVFGLASFVSAQPRQAEKTAPAKQIPNELVSVEAKYEGGIYGSTGREKGTLKIDDVNKRVIFDRKSDGREMISIPYDSLLVVYPDSKVSTSQTGNVVSRLPLPGAGLAGLLSTRAQYLVVTFDDPDIDVRGTANFKFDDKKKLLAFIDTLGSRAKLKQRGNAYYRPRDGSDF